MDREREFKAIKIGVMRSKPFELLRAIMMLGKTVFTDAVPTACTNGRDVWYNLMFLFEKIANGKKGIAFIMVHEAMHKAAQHMVVYIALWKIDPKLANAATDYWINGRIIKADPKGEIVEMPVDHDGKVMGLFDPKYDDWTVKRIFNQLKQEQDENTDERPEENDGEAGDTGEAGDGGSDFDEHDWEGANAIPEDELKELEQDVKEAIRQGMHVGRKAGSDGLSDELGLGELVIPKVDWRVQLRTFMNSTCRRKDRSTWRRPNRRFLHQDIIMPSLEGRGIRELLLARDASGSMHWQDRMAKVTSEMVSIAKQLDIEKVHILDWDGSVSDKGHSTYSSKTLDTAPEIGRVYGGGGTNPRCVAEYVEKTRMKLDCIIILTDGEIDDWGNWKHPLLWLITNDKPIKAPVGKTVNID
jgi:predicted metal-dependent peptidase